MEFIDMVHPDVEGIAIVPRSAIGQHALQGWRPKDEVDAESAASTAKKSTPVKES